MLRPHAAKPLLVECEILEVVFVFRCSVVECGGIPENQPVSAVGVEICIQVAEEYKNKLESYFIGLYWITFLDLQM